jgi:hypothetical protein
MAGNQSRQIFTQTQVGDANGVCTFTFAPPPGGMVLTGTLNVVNSAATNKWTMYLGAAPQGDSIPGIPIITSIGTSAIHDVQQQANEYVVLQSTGVAAGVSRTATFHCIGSDARTTPLQWPKNQSQASNAAVTIANAILTADNVELLGGPFTASSATVTLPPGSWGVRVTPGSGVFPPGVAAVTVQGVTTGGFYTSDWTGHCFPIQNAAETGVTVTWLGSTPAAWYVSSAEAPQEIMTISAVPNIIHSTSGIVALSSTAVTNVVPAPAEGYVHLFGVTVYAGAVPPTAPFLLQATAAGSTFDALSVLVANGVARADYSVSPDLNFIGGGGNGLWIATASVAGCSAVARYTVGNSP